MPYVPSRDAVRFVFSGAALTAAIGYYLGSIVGLSLRLPQSTPSVMWPPNAILTGVLLLTPPGRWPLILLAALPAHFAAQLPTDWSFFLVLALFATNCAEALLAAAGVRLLGDRSAQVDTLRRFGAFFFAAVIAAPLLSTFADAAVVAWLNGDLYWQVWRNRLMSNVLAQLVVTPAVIGIAPRARAWLAGAWSWRHAEAATLVMCLIGSGWLTFSARFESAQGLAVLTRMPVVVQLPFVLWATLRFGPAGASLALLTMTCMTAWSVVQGGSLFRSVPRDQLVFTVQTLLIIVAITVQVLATLIEERRQSMHALSERLRFEKLLSKFSRAFVQVPSEHMTAVCDEWLGHIGAFLNVDCVRVFQIVSEEGDMGVVAEWRRAGFGRIAPVFKHDFPWIMSRVLAHSPVVLPSLSALPAEAAHDYSSLKAQGYNAVLVIPLLAAERLVGALSFKTASARPWSDELVAHLSLFSEVLANALARRQTDDALRASEVMKSAILASLPSGVALIDGSGRLLDVNRNWFGLADESPLVAYKAIRLGDNLLELSAPKVVQGIKSVLEGSQSRFAIEAVSAGPSGTRWWLLGAMRLSRERGGAVVTLTEITERRRAEVEAERTRQELAHVGRVATIGELTASLAHQLNQPLTGIMGNAQAARRLLERMPPDCVELRETMSDIIDDARRASEVIHRVHQLLRRSDFEMAPLDLGAVICDVAKLVSSNAIIRNVTVTLDLDAAPIMVLGDRVQMQQVVLNLLVNALEAIDTNDGERAVRLSCQRSSPHEVRVIVRDSGVGLVEGAEELVFDPFYTTKANGMGMGLSIARSIVETHGGSIRASRDRTRGTTVEFTLPTLEAAALV